LLRHGPSPRGFWPAYRDISAAVHCDGHSKLRRHRLGAAVRGPSLAAGAKVEGDACGQAQGMSNRIMSERAPAQDALDSQLERGTIGRQIAKSHRVADFFYTFADREIDQATSHLCGPQRGDDRLLEQRGKRDVTAVGAAIEEREL